MAKADAHGRIQSLISLLDDEDESVAVNAMAKLLSAPEGLGDALAKLQDSTDPLTRRRAHQLQAALSVRQRRAEFWSRLNDPQLPLIDALIEVHMQWFDNDQPQELKKLWRELASAACRCHLQSLEQLGSFMRREDFLAEPDTTFRPEFYCLGEVMDERVGSGAVLAAMARELYPDGGKLKLMRILDEFALVDPDGVALFPLRAWRLMRVPDLSGCEQWSNLQLLKFASGMLFSAAVNSDSFRYVLTIAQALSGRGGGDALEGMPYPFNT